MSPESPELSAIELMKIIPLDQAAKKRGCSVDTLKRHDADNVIQISPRRLGKRLYRALLLPQPKII